MEHQGHRQQSLLGERGALLRLGPLTSYANTAIIGLLVVLTVFVLLPRLFGRRLSSRSKGWSVLILGPTGAGKTALFWRLRDGKFKNTVMSMQPNQCDVTVERQKSIHVIDLPGHPRLESYFQREVVNAKGVVMMVDAMDFNSSKDEVARQMYRLLTSPVIRGRGVPILVACNKQDGGAKAHSTDFIRKRLEKLIFEMYQSDTGDSMTGSSANEHNILSATGDGFTFADLAVRRRFHRPLQVSFAKVSVKEDDIAPISQFFAEL
jgi:signal recognition particle receptor subunit beta